MYLYTPPTPAPTPPTNASWTQFKDTNCFGDGHGAKDLEGGGKDCGEMTLAACEDKCGALPGCRSVTWDTSTQKCYRRGYINLDMCDEGAPGKGFDTWVNYPTAGKGTPTPAGISVRVARGMGTRGYASTRLSLIRYSGSAPNASSADLKWDYSEPFKYRWTDNHLSTALVNVTPGVASPFSLDGNKINVTLPKQGDGSIGILIGDPCIKSPWSDACSSGEGYRNKQVLNGVLNSMAAHDDLDYFILMGDLFYDNSGAVTKEFFKGLTLEASAKAAGAVMGNHDFWICGSPDCGVESDSFANGHMQWYAGDTEGSVQQQQRQQRQQRQQQHLSNGSLSNGSLQNGSAPFDFRVDPDTKTETAIENTVWYNMVGNVATLGFSNAYSWNASVPHFTKACQWVAREKPALVIMIGHWHGSGMGCPSGMDTDHVFTSIQTLPGCDDLGGRLKYFEGHTHTNQILQKDTGFLLGSFGYNGQGEQLGLPILDTRGGRVKLNYFQLAENGVRSPDFDEILGCFGAKGYSGCMNYSTSWLDQSLADLVAEVGPVEPAHYASSN
jgi:hypothetical protein